MGKQLSMARSEATRQTVLLASSRFGILSKESSCRDERKEEDSHVQDQEGQEISYIEEESKSKKRTAAANTSRPRAKRRRQSNSVRRAVGGDEGGDINPRRSAKEMDIRWPGSYCNGVMLNPHYLVAQAGMVGGGYVFRCIKCHAHKWLPVLTNDCYILGRLMSKYGDTPGYQRMLDEHPKAKVLMAKLQDLEYIRKVVEDDRTFAQVVGVVMSSQEYDKEVGNE